MLIIALLFISIELTLGKLKVIGPEELKYQLDQKNGEIQFSIANFGNVPWGRRLSGTLDISDPLQACTEINQTVKSHFVLIKRGNCTFVTKVRNAQNAGYQLAIIEDNKEEIIDNITMSDDGTGYGLQIPSIFISKSDGEILSMQKFFCFRMRQINGEWFIIHNHWMINKSKLILFLKIQQICFSNDFPKKGSIEKQYRCNYWLSNSLKNQCSLQFKLFEHNRHSL